MKKLLLVLAIGAFAACNDSATTTETANDSSANATVDSLQTAPVDTTTSSATVDTTGAGAGTSTDTTKAK